MGGWKGGREEGRKEGREERKKGADRYGLSHMYSTAEREREREIEIWIRFMVRDGGEE